MVASNWKPSLKAVLNSEGGNDDDPSDHGGRTSRGITQREYTAWRKLRGMPVLDVWRGPQSDIEAVYHEEYWEPYCDALPIGADFLLFNMNVNAGPHQAAIILQRALGTNPDGRIGPITMLAIKSADPRTLIENYSVACRNFYVSLHQPKYTRGWLNRVEFVKNTALRMVAQKGNGDVDKANT